MATIVTVAIVQLTGAGDGVGGCVLTMAVGVTMLRGQLKHRTAMIALTLMTVQVVVMLGEIFLFDALLALVLPSNEGGHLDMHRVQLLDARVDVHVPQR